MLHRARRNFSNLWSKGLAFPLERLHGLISNGVWSDEVSQSIWDSLYNSPYQLWEEDPASGVTLQLQDVAFACPWCSQSEMRVCDLASFTQTHITKNALSACPACGHKFNADKLSAQYLKEDLTEFIAVQDAWYLSPMMTTLIQVCQRSNIWCRRFKPRRNPHGFENHPRDCFASTTIQKSSDINRIVHFHR
jgi:hypothetical protein